MQEVRVGVRELLNTVFHTGDHMEPGTPSGREGIAGHQLLTAGRPEGYRKEVALERAFEWEEYRLVVSGRLDGLWDTGTSLVAEEIKTTYAALNTLQPDEWHQAQLKLYMHFIQAENPAGHLEGRLTYLNLDDLSERSFSVSQTTSEGEDFFLRLAAAYLESIRERDSWRMVRNESLERLPFPHTGLRAGQDELIECVGQAIEQENDLFAEAATGIGKTIAVLFPALKRMAETSRYDRIFFLTAKTAGKAIVRKTLHVLHDHGLRLRTVFIEAKERVCLAPGSRCHPRECIYAADYYNKAARIMLPLLSREMVAPEVLRAAAAEAKVCPFELSLDLALEADLIVCDYNYVFDPRVYLKRFFMSPSQRDNIFLIDEAHNLLPRGREMYSEQLDQSEISALLHTAADLDEQVTAACQGLGDFFTAWGKEMEKEGKAGLQLGRVPEMLEPALERLATALQERLRSMTGPGPLYDKLLDHYYHVSSFARIVSLVDEHYAIYTKKENDAVHLRLFCLNPGPLLRKRLEHSRCSVFFSATLSPHSFFQELLGGRPNSFSIRLTSPFPQENRLYVHVPGIDTRFRCREQTAAAVARSAADMVLARSGNYMMFFPSYSYLQVVEPLVKTMLAGRCAIWVQRPSMTEAHKQEFIRRVTAVGGQANMGLAVLGGLFGEGVDMPGEQLIGVLIVGPGLPAVSDEQELIRMYFDERNGQGFMYAYVIPGLIRVIQSAGRVFRTPEDKGVVMLVDDRFADERYQEMLPPDWFMPGRPYSCSDYRELLASFWAR